MSQPLARAVASDAPQGPPPLLGTWPRVYASVLIAQVIFAAALWALARMFGGPQ